MLERKAQIWVELQHKDHACDRLLAEQLQLHPLTIEDIWASQSQPKLEEYEKYLYVMIHSIAGTKAHDIELLELDVVIGPTYVITYDPHGLVQGVRGELDRSVRLLEQGPASLAHAILDSAVDRYLPVIDDLDSQLEDLEEEALRKAGTKQGPRVLRRILAFRRILLTLRRTSIHQREVLLRLARGEFVVIPPAFAPFYRDVYDHFLRVNDLIESYRDLVTSALDAYLSVQSNRMNEIMKTLTLMSTVMLPLTFVAGVYGMNFEYMPELKASWGYPGVLVAMVVFVTCALLWFRHRGWIGSKDIDVLDKDGADGPASK